MNNIGKAIKHVRRQLIAIKLLDVFINSILILLGAGVFLVLIALPWFYAFIAMAVYFIPKSIKGTREIKIKEAEEKIPELEWQLRTAEDTVGKENEIVDSLHQRVLSKIMQIRNVYLLDNKKVAYRITGIIGLFIMLVSFSMLNFNILDINDPQSVTGLFTKTSNPKNDINNDSSNLFESKFGSRDIYGDEDVAKLGDEELELELSRENSELDYDSLTDAEAKEFSQKGGFGDIGATADASFDEKINKEDQEIVKNYFEKLAGGQ